MDSEDYKVSSELYTEYDYVSRTAKPMANKRNVVSKFKFKFPPEPPGKDSDGDFILTRKKNEPKYGIVEIEHSQRTNLELVGLQIWRGALLLGDWLLQFGSSFEKDTYILELGAGVGFTSIVASIFSPVLCTDLNKGGLFRIINHNILRNKHLSKHDIKVIGLDFMSQVLPQDIVKLIPKTSIVIAADVIYDDIITEAFVKTVQHILSKPPKRSVYVALEKRFVFTLADCDAVAPCYEYFLKCLNLVPNVTTEEVRLDFPQYFHYDRVKELTLWKITSNFVYECDN